jgi:hypothetical protein
MIAGNTLLMENVTTMDLQRFDQFLASICKDVHFQKDFLQHICDTINKVLNKVFFYLALPVNLGVC